MKKLICEICGSSGLIKCGGTYTCPNCGTKYTTEEARKLMVDAPDDAESVLPESNTQAATIPEPANTPENTADARQTLHKLKFKPWQIALAACLCIALVVLTITVIVPAVRYNNAVNLMNSGSYEEAIAAFESLGDYKYSAELLDNCRTEKAYEDAVNLMNDGKYDEAITAFEALGDYKDSADKIDDCKLGTLRNAEVGSIVEFGTYEQDNDSSNGQETIEWLVLAKEDSKMLVISDKALDCKPYNTSLDFVTWDTCTLRSWLNDDFYNKSFAEDEQKLILTTNLGADKNPEYDSGQSKATKDKVFLLSASEALEYFPEDSQRICEPTYYAASVGDNATPDSVFCKWWLRTTGYNYYFAVTVIDNGAINVIGTGIDTETEAMSLSFFGYRLSNQALGVLNEIGTNFTATYGTTYVRPAMWIDVSAEK